MAKLNFAHLLGIKKSASEDDDDKEKSKKAKSRRAEEEDRDEEDAEDEDDDTKAEDDDPDAEDDDDQDDKDKSSKKGKKAKSRRAEDDDDDENAEEDDDKEKGRRAEQKRCAAIFGSKHAANRPDMAAHLAFNTRMSAREAISTLAAMGVSAPRRASLDERMQQSQQVRLGPDARQPARGSVEALVANATSLYNSVKGKK
ncbi:hypothetical protein OO184_21935 [Photorhabdus sp. APURE]|uniref:hypothetical protein n=1 Tax=Photorhabdus aballayi TaxID=2991723 RepID=UPI00223CC9DB|nr:hypothetical protein [Photorhabdus aballayi]MCW7550514.1 hypothetical protein [Photorhabdus aballayi]